MVVVKVTLEYDGTRLLRLGSPARAAHGRRRARAALDRVYPQLERARRRRAHGRGRPCARAGRELRGRGRPAARARRPGAERRASRRRRRRRERGARRRASAPASRRPPASYRYRVWRRRESARRSSGAARSGSRGPSTRTRWPRRRRSLAGEHDFRAFTPTETQHDSFVRVVREAAWHARRRRPRLDDHGGQLPAPHGAHARRDDARAQDPDALAAASRRPPARRGGRDRAAVGALPRAGATTGERRRATIDACATPRSSSISTAR